MKKVHRGWAGGNADRRGHVLRCQSCHTWETNGWWPLSGCPDNLAGTVARAQHQAKGQLSSCLEEVTVGAGWGWAEVKTPWQHRHGHWSRERLRATRQRAT